MNITSSRLQPILIRRILNPCKLCCVQLSVRNKANTSHKVFDRRMKRQQREQTAKLEDFDTYQYVKEEIGFRMAEKVWDIKRVFHTGVELSSGTGFIAQHIDSNFIENYVICDTSTSNLGRVKLPETTTVSKMLIDEEHLPFRDESVDIFLSSLSTHWVNELPELFREVSRCLTKNGVFLGCLFGGHTLYELRCSLQLAETEREGGFAPHISPFVEPVDIGALMSRAGFDTQTIDTDEIVITYPSMFHLIFDLQSMGESNAAWNRRLNLKRDSMLAAAAIYKEFYGKDQDEVPATFQITNFIGWKPDPSAPKPIRKESPEASMEEFSKMIRSTPPDVEIKH